MSKYLEDLKAALSLTENCQPGSRDYQDGWCCAKEDLTYGISCGSEHAVKSQMAPWLMGEDSPYFESLDSESDKGYCDRIKAIQLLMEKCDETSN